jgi:superfamily II DNA or RNA helicase
MTLSKRLAHYFDAGVRSRGETYLSRGRVRVLRASGDEVEANVRGSSGVYDVSLDFADGVLDTYCECPYFDSAGLCKHIWAVILAAEARGHLAGAASAKDLRLEGGVLDEDYEPDDEAPHFRLRQPLAPPPKPPAWRKDLAAITSRHIPVQHAWPDRREILYIVDGPASAGAGNLTLELGMRNCKADGSYGAPALLSLHRTGISKLPDPADRAILSALTGVVPSYAFDYYTPDASIQASRTVTYPLAATIMAQAAVTRRCYLRKERGSQELTPLTWDDGPPWQFRLEMRRRPQGLWQVAGILQRADTRMELKAAGLVTPGGLVFAESRVAMLAEDASFEWLSALSRSPILAKPGEGEQLLEALLCARDLPPLDVPEELRFEEVRLLPQPRLLIHAPDRRASQKLHAELRFDYGGRVVPSHETAPGLYDAAKRRFARRDFGAEQAATTQLSELGWRSHPSNYLYPAPGWELAPTKLPRTVRALVEAGWHIEADGKMFRRPGAFQMRVSTGIDWFELHGGVDYGETTAKLPQLLAALRHGDGMVQLDDGTYGVLPEDWMRRLGPLANLGVPADGHIRFRHSQVGLLDALLAAQPIGSCDEAFLRIREQLGRFQGVEPAPQPAGFVGSLRDYQREGLGWMHFLRRFSFGGCLADDMGVGKTAQVLALLETRREERAAGAAAGLSLVVVPRSLVFNWKQEAARFTPQLRVLDYTGLAREENDFSAYDVVLSTYGTLRRDAGRLKDMEFDYIVLDEAQAVKNPGTGSAKAARLLRGNHRLALSGTPVENHLGELWSLFEFLNPGMLGSASVFKLAGGPARNPDEDTRRILAQALRPFILRRTKEQVARELPAKTEQTIYCEMEPVQQKLYNELRLHYRYSLLKRIETEGLAKSKIQVLEALLRLRQAACHPGLLDKKRAGEGSAKLDVLLEQLREITDEGHKALVFSQFTSLLDIVRERLERSGIGYEYLDGSTRDRQAPVERFQNEPGCRLFLISLKAGGLGLNLTAAEYVFLLDPWWNPAVETQAIDRAHRIGQTRRVFAYRLIARDTVEEKVLELQKNKRDLAAAIIGEDNRLIGTLAREDLELLLS